MGWQVSWGFSFQSLGIVVHQRSVWYWVQRVHLDTHNKPFGNCISWRSWSSCATSVGSSYCLILPVVTPRTAKCKANEKTGNMRWEKISVTSICKIISVFGGCVIVASLVHLFLISLIPKQQKQLPLLLNWPDWLAGCCTLKSPFQIF